MLDLQVEHWPALRPLVLVIKSLLKANGLNDVSTGGLGSFALANMALAHLQEEAKVRVDFKRRRGCLVGACAKALS